MTDIFMLQTALAQTLAADPVLCLAQATAWIDPLWQDVDDFEPEEDVLPIALHILRTAFPEIYFDALQALRHGATEAMLDGLICSAIQGYGIPLESLDWMSYGVPIPAYGVNLDDPDFYTSHPDVIPVLECFGISPEPNSYSITVPDCVYTAGRLIAVDLEQHPDERYRQIAWLMRWLMGCSNNSAIDCDDETLAEFQPLLWEPDDIAFAIDIIEEANGILSDVRAGLALLNSQPKVMTALQRNVQRIYRAIKRPGKRSEPKVGLKWVL